MLYLESKLFFKHMRNKESVGMHFPPIPATVRDHNGRHSLCNGIEIRHHMYVNQAFETSYSVVAINALHSATITNKMLGCSCHTMPERKRKLDILSGLFR
mgnify:CR=1 FL=1